MSRKLKIGDRVWFTGCAQHTKCSICCACVGKLAKSRPDGRVYGKIATGSSLALLRSSVLVPNEGFLAIDNDMINVASEKLDNHLKLVKRQN